ncbi:1-phosphatidylinositol-3-phosphate 5-kinase FAB1A isoform X2 [Physcomitrium patens]|uniref:1-phosphatidylinositol-3-phosphate 5-kinase n=1 Tax=Physcomitrium patens TaxID=3218 RepID=A0A7I4B8A6_PHYPA|nr:1-phosphatidylinositol-3-phosphate 5-kinase FAB1B-like isoform X2 [Physcomitrium patens]|eukprot:XP_024401237.1 1-phosphatidylinositol-3-phosphate 5-kinase FAB1B-like isoform X2 [Physcomitrella patens]
MEEAANALADIVERVSSWIPRLGSREDDATIMSRDFWMPDRSCRMCYECDSQFTIFNRRHHCRICGRVFCGKCTLNTIPASFCSRTGHDENERVRVCNFCFKLRREQEYTDRVILSVDSPSSQIVSPSEPGYDFNMASGSTTKTLSRNYDPSYSPTPTPASDGTVVDLEASVDGKPVCPSSMGTQPDSTACLHMQSRDQSSSFYEFCRSDDEEDLGQKTERDLYDEDDSVLDLDYGDGSRGNVHIPKEDSHHAERVPVLVDKASDSRIADGESSAMWRTTQSCDDIESLDGILNEPPMYEEETLVPPVTNEIDHPNVDYESNGVIWVPPPPEDEDEDDAEMSLVDEDDEDVEWVPRMPGSVSSSENRSKAAMRAIVDGHFRALVAQLLIAEDVRLRDGGPSSWLEIVSTLSLQAANLVKPDTSKGGGMDPGGYVKVKCIASGRREDSMVVKGIVCHKNVQNRRMASRFKSPRVLLLGGALEYHRVSNQLSSLDTLLQQERDHLSMTVARIEAYHPNVLLVEKTVSRYAQDKLLEKDISVVLNVKRPLLERIARCTGAQIVASPEYLMAPTLGQCEFFHIEKFVEEHDYKDHGGRPGPKYLIFFEGCPRPLGCTVLLRGATTEELKSVKKVVQFAVFAAYHLALETSFLADEGATLPELSLLSPGSTAQGTARSSDKPVSTTSGFTNHSSSGHSHVLNSQFEHQGASLAVGANLDPPQGTKNVKHNSSRLSWKEGSSMQLSSVGDLHQLEQLSKQENMDFNEGSTAQGTVMKDDFASPLSDHQSILVSLSSRCLRKGSVCERPHLKRIKYYGSSDKPLGKFLKDSLFNVTSSCGSCEEPLDSHVHCYTHRQGSLTISVQRLRDFELPGEKDGRIWMWHRCLRCPRTDGVPPATRRLVMSDAAWGLSFGKFLELSFSNHAAASRAAACGHSLHRDCLRFYGCGSFVACFKYATINLHSVAVPPPQLEFHNPKQQGWLLNEANEVANKSDLVFAEIFNAIGVLGEKISSSKFVYSSAKLSEARRQIVELESLLQREKAEVEAQLHKAAPLSGPLVADILALNKIRQHLSDTSAAWEECLCKLSGSLKVRHPMRTSDPGFLDSTLLLSKIGNSSFGRSRNLEGNSIGKEERMTISNPDMGNRKEQELADDCIGEIIEQTAPKQQNTQAILDISGDSGSEGALRLLASPVASNSPKNVTTISVSGVHPLLLDEIEESSRTHFNSSIGLSKQLSSPLPIAGALEDLASAENMDSLQEGFRIGNKVLASLNCPNEGEASLITPLPEGLSPIPTDSENLEGVWLGSISSMDVSNVHEGLGVHKVISSPGGMVNIGIESSQEMSLVHGGDLPLQDREVVEKSDATLQSNGPASPLRSVGKDKESSEDSLGVPAGTLSNLPHKNVYSLPGSTQSSIAGSPPRANPSTPMIVSLTGHLSAPGAARLSLPPCIHDTVINVYDDELTSIIAYALLTPKYQAELREAVVENDKDKPKEKLRESEENEVGDFSNMMDSIHQMEEPTACIDVENDLILKEKLLRTASTEVLTPREKRDVKVAFTEQESGVSVLSGKVEFRVTCYYAKQFDALRKKCCGGDMDYIRSMSRCKKWGAHGGKSNVFFAKTMDDRFVVKQVTSTEKISFLDFAPRYFNYLTESINSGSPTCLAKIVGLYRVSVRQAKGNKELDLLVMENLLYARNVSRLYDLKGSVRSRYNSDLTGNNKVLLDENLLEMMPTSPIFVSNKAKRLLERAVWNDTAFLAGVHVMDYSLLVGVDDERQELVLGIIDFIRQYTWDKHLETWVKASGILGGPKNAAPTVISPKQYKKRFRKAMSTYFVMVPDQWSPSPPLMGPLRTSELPSSDDVTSVVAPTKEAKLLSAGC